MKSFPVALATHYAQPTTTLASCIRITRRDATVIGYTSLDRPLVVDGVSYEPGCLLSSIASSAGMNVDNLELTVVPTDAEAGLRADLLAGKWDGAQFLIFVLDWTNPAGGIDEVKAGTLGEVAPNRDGFVVELRSIEQALQQQIGDVTQKTCRYRLGDARCRVNLTSWTHTAAVTAVTSRSVFTAASLAQAADYFTEGELRFLSGANAGFARKIKSSASGGALTLSIAAPYDVAAGDTLQLIAGCRKRHLEDCKTKFSNILNFGGEPHLAGIDALTSSPKGGV